MLPVITYKRLDEALDYINNRPRPLALYLFDDESKTQDMVMKQTIAGGVCLNETLFHIAQENLPWYIGSAVIAISLPSSMSWFSQAEACCKLATILP